MLERFHSTVVKDPELAHIAAIAEDHFQTNAVENNRLYEESGNNVHKYWADTDLANADKAGKDAIRKHQVQEQGAKIEANAGKHERGREVTRALGEASLGFVGFQVLGPAGAKAMQKSGRKQK